MLTSRMPLRSGISHSLSPDLELGGPLADTEMDALSALSSSFFSYHALFRKGESE